MYGPGGRLVAECGARPELSLTIVWYIYIDGDGCLGYDGSHAEFREQRIRLY